MVTEMTGDIFSDEEAILIIPVNCVGVMGAGLAKEYKRKFPSQFKRYKEECDSGFLNIGYPIIICYTREDANAIPHIMFPTKFHWRDPSKLEYIESGLNYLSRILKHFNCLNEINRMNVPALGCGLGGLNYGDVKSVIFNCLKELEKWDIKLFKPM